MTLYEINNEFVNLNALLIDADAEEQEEINALIATTKEELLAKVDGYAKAMKNAEAEAEAYKAERDRLDEKLKRVNKNIERMKEIMLRAFQLAGIEEAPTSIGKWKKRLNPYSVNVVDESKVPEKFLIAQPPKVDKRALLSEFKKTGEVFDGCEFDRKESISFR